LGCASWTIYLSKNLIITTAYQGNILEHHPQDPGQYHTVMSPGTADICLILSVQVDH